MSDSQVPKVEIKALLEICDHCGYCSGEDTKYSSKEITKFFDLPDNFKDPSTWGSIENHDWVTELNDKYPPKMCDDSMQSGYCDLDMKSRKAGLSQHEYKFTVLSVTVIL
jgi:hypothetical protein